MNELVRKKMKNVGIFPPLIHFSSWISARSHRTRSPWFLEARAIWTCKALKRSASTKGAQVSHWKGVPRLHFTRISDCVFFLKHIPEGRMTNLYAQRTVFFKNICAMLYHSRHHHAGSAVFYLFLLAQLLSIILEPYYVSA